MLRKYIILGSGDFAEYTLKQLEVWEKFSHDVIDGLKALGVHEGCTQHVGNGKYLTFLRVR